MLDLDDVRWELGRFGTLNVRHGTGSPHGTEAAAGATDQRRSQPALVHRGRARNVRLDPTGHEVPLFLSERMNTDGTCMRATADVFRRSLPEAADRHLPTWLGKVDSQCAAAFLRVPALCRRDESDRDPGVPWTRLDRHDGSVYQPSGIASDGACSHRSPAERVRQWWHGGCPIADRPALRAGRAHRMHDPCLEVWRRFAVGGRCGAGGSGGCGGIWRWFPGCALKPVSSTGARCSRQGTGAIANIASQAAVDDVRIAHPSSPQLAGRAVSADQSGTSSEGQGRRYSMVGDTHSFHSARVMLAVSLLQSSSRHLLGPGQSTQPSSPLDTMWLPSAVVSI